MRSKLSIARATLPLEGHDVIAFSETNFNSSHYSSELGLKNYSIYRCDRDLTRSIKKSGGGVLLAVKGCFLSSLICHSSVGFEQLFVRLSVRNRNSKINFILCVVYIPPSSPSTFFSAHLEEVERVSGLYPDYNFILVGDYNLPELSWSDESSLDPSASQRSDVFS